MADPYVGEIRMFGGDFAPSGWALCNGQLLPIGQYDALYSLIGTTYGGNGQTDFALPNLQGRLPVHQDTGFVLGQAGGAEQVTLTDAQLPTHSHSFNCSTSPGAARTPAGNVPATVVGSSIYVQAPASAALALPSIGADPGGSGAHNNMQPYQCVTFIISLFGLFPTPS